MGTTGHAAAVTILDELTASGIGFAILHREAEFARDGVTSDIDTIVDRDPDTVMQALAPVLADRGLRLIMRWPYDRNSISFFLSDDDGARGAQLDLVHDPDGAGRYGFRTSVLLDGAVAGVRWTRLGELDESLYLLRKRQVKRDQGAVRQLLNELPVADREALIDRAGRSFSTRGAEALRDMLTTGEYQDPGSAAFDRKLWNLAANASHYATRLNTRIGLWVRAPDADLATVREAIAPLEGHLPVVDAVAGPRSPIRVELDRRRPRLIVSAGTTGRGRPDVVLTGTGTADELRRRIVASMADRLEVAR